MPSFDLKKISLTPASPKHSKHALYLRRMEREAQKMHRLRLGWSVVFVILTLAVSGHSLALSDQAALRETYLNSSTFGHIRGAYLARYNSLPVEKIDAKTQALAEYLKEKKSPLVEYAGELARLPNWKLLVGIAHAESNLCKKTLRNNCWGIGPGGPWAFGEITESLYYANYLLSKFRQLGMDEPETLVRTYVGYHNPNWIEAVHDVFYELQERGLQ